MEAGLIEQLIALLLLFTTIAGVVTTTIDQIKPLVLDQIFERYGERVYLFSLYTIRFAVALFGVLSFGGAETIESIITTVPDTVPEVTLIVVSTLFVTLGSDFLHVLLDILYGFRDAQRGEEPEEPVDGGSGLAALMQLRESLEAARTNASELGEEITAAESNTTAQAEG